MPGFDRPHRPSRAERAFITTLGIIGIVSTLIGVLYVGAMILYHNPWVGLAAMVFGVTWAVIYRFTPPS